MAGEKEVIVINSETNEKIIFPSLTNVCKYFGVEKYVISRHIIKSGDKLFNGKFIIKYTGVKSARLNFKYNVGDIISDTYGNIKILKQTITNNLLSYEYICLKCGYKGILTQNKLIKRKIRCSSCCKNSKIINDKNCLATKYPWILKFLKEKDDGKKYLPGSNKKIVFKCPICGDERNCTINKIVKKGYSCLKCGNGVSYPQKIMRIILEKTGIDFETEKKFDWSNNKRYDFYIPSKNILIEVDGSQHLYEENIKNDVKKEKLAKDNGIRLIRIKAYESNYKYVENELKNIDFFNLLGLNKVDIKECDIILKKGNDLYKTLIKLWNDGLTVSEISKILNIKNFNIRNYLKKLSDLNLIIYDGKKEINRKTKKTVLDTFTNKKYNSILECSKKVGISRSTIKRNTQKRFKFI